MSAVWGTIRDALKAAVYTDFNAMPFERESAMLDAMAADLEAKLPLLTPAHAAVIEAAVASFHDTETSAMELERALEKAVAILRKQEAET